MKKHYNQIAGFNKHRLESLSDGIFAIALTLLILDVRVPVSEIVNSETDLISAFFTVTPNLLTYFMSFITLGVYWSAHSTQFHYISRSDRHLNWISLFFLLVVSLIPFTTAFLSRFITFKFAIGLYWLNIMLLGLMLGINWRYVLKHNLLNIDEIERKEVSQAIKRRFVEAHSLYTIGTLLCFINTYCSIIMLILVQLNFALAPSFRRKKIDLKKTEYDITL